MSVWISPMIDCNSFSYTGDRFDEDRICVPELRFDALLANLTGIPPHPRFRLNPEGSGLRFHLDKAIQNHTKPMAKVVMSHDVRCMEQLGRAFLCPLAEVLLSCFVFSFSDWWFWFVCALQDTVQEWLENATGVFSLYCGGWNFKVQRPNAATCGWIVKGSLIEKLPIYGLLKSKVKNQ